MIEDLLRANRTIAGGSTLFHPKNKLSKFSHPTYLVFYYRNSFRRSEMVVMGACINRFFRNKKIKSDFFFSDIMKV